MKNKRYLTVVELPTNTPTVLQVSVRFDEGGICYATNQKCIECRDRILAANPGLELIAPAV